MGGGGGSLFHDGNTDIVMGGTCRPSEVRKYLYNGARSIVTVTKFNLKRLKLAIIHQSGKSSGLLYAIEIKNVTTF